MGSWLVWLMAILGLLLLGGIGYWGLSCTLRVRTRDLRAALAQREEAELALRYRLSFDPQTGLAQAAYFINQLDDYFHRHQLPVAQPKDVIIVKLLGLDDQLRLFGFARSEQLVSLVVRHLHQLPLELAGYLGRGAFALFVDKNNGGDCLAQLRQALSEDALGRSARLVAGLATWPEQGRSATKLMRHAETALAIAVATHTSWLAYEPMMEPSSATMDIVQIFMAGDVAGLCPLFQPQLDLRSGKILSADIRVQWRHPALGLVDPKIFIPLVEQAGLIAPLSAFLLNEAARVAAQLRAAGLACTLGVKVSVSDLLGADLVTTITAALQCHGAQPQDLKLELSERQLVVNSALVKAELTRLNALGIQAVLDDVGTGYLSLTELSHLALGEVKIDSAFVGDMLTNERSYRIVRASIAMARELGLKTLAKGVENDKTLQRLQRDGCDIAQGLVIAKPMVEAEFMAYMKAHAQLGFSLS